MGLRYRRPRHLSGQCRARGVGCVEATGEWCGRSTWRPGSPRRYGTARSAGGNRPNGANGIHGCDWSDRYGPVEPARDGATCSDCGGSSRRDTAVCRRPVSIRDIPLERWRDSLHHRRTSRRRQIAVICSGCGASVECPSRRDGKAACRRSHDTARLRTLRGELALGRVGFAAGGIPVARGFASAI